MNKNLASKLVLVTPRATMNGSTASVAALDISKACDKDKDNKLFSKLIEAGQPKWRHHTPGNIFTKYE